MEIVIIVLVLLIPAWFITSSVMKQKKLDAWRAECKAEASVFLRYAKENNGIKQVTTNLMLKKGEAAFYCDDVDLYETRSVRTSTTAFSGVRVMKGVYIGGARGTSTSNQQWTCMSSGKLVITNKRLIFDGGNVDRNIPLDKIFSAESSADGVEISCENRQKSMIYACKNPLILAIIVRICAGVPDPTNLGDVKLDINLT